MTINPNLLQTRSLSAMFILLLCVFSISSSSLAQTDKDLESDDTEQVPLEKGDSEVSDGMTEDEMANIIGDIAGEYDRTGNSIRFEIDGAPMLLISSPQANRMRLIAPIIAAEDMDQEHFIATLVANYHLALDARYAVGDGVLQSVFIHPLKELTRGQLESAVRQVSTLRATFGTTYTSGELSFGAQQRGESI